MVRKYLCGLLCVLLGLQGAMVNAAPVDARVDRNPVQEDESFTLEFSATALDGDPDFSELEKDFRILQRNQSSSFQLINGRMSQNANWTLTLMPKRVGILNIPPIAFGKSKSTPLEIRVVASSQPEANNHPGDLFFLEVTPDAGPVYVQAQLLVTVRLYRAVETLMDAGLSDLRVDDKDAIIEKLDQDKTYDKELNGRTYKVFEKKYAVFPQKPGNLQIQPVQFETRFVDNRRALRYKKLNSDPFNVEVYPIPSTYRSSQWLPARALRLDEEWSPTQPSFRQGEPTTRTIRITADGLPGALLPELAKQELGFAKLYPDQPLIQSTHSDAGVIGVREEKLAIIPVAAGEFELPALEVVWWDTLNKREQIAQLPARKLTVLPSNVQGGAAASSATTPAAVAAPGAKPILPAAPTAATATVPVVAESLWGSKKFWFGLSLLLLYLWLLTLLAWWYLARRRTRLGLLKLPVANPIDLKRRELEKAIKSACAKRDLDNLKRLLIQWSVAVFGNNAPHSVGGLARRCGGVVGDELEYLNSLLYGAVNSPQEQRRFWDGEALYPALKQYSRVDDGVSTEGGLKPLFQILG